MDYEAYTKDFDKKKESEVYFQTAFHGTFNDFSRFSAEYIGQATENKSGSLLYGKPSNILMCLFDYDVTPIINFLNNNELTSPADN